MSTDVDISGLQERRARFEEKMRPQWRDIASFIGTLVRHFIAEAMDLSPLPKGQFSSDSRLHYGKGTLANSFIPGARYNIFIVDIRTDRVRVIDGSEAPHAAIHEFGGFIRDQGKMTNYFWAQYIRSQLPYWRILALSAAIKGGVRMKAHPYAGTAEALMATEGLEHIAEEVMDRITRTWNAVQQ